MNKNWAKSCRKCKMANGTVAKLQGENEENTSHNMLHATLPDSEESALNDLLQGHWQGPAVLDCEYLSRQFDEDHYLTLEGGSIP